MFLTIPALIKVFCVFGLILILNRTRINLSLSLLICSIVLGAWMGTSFSGLARSAYVNLFCFQSISLILIVGTIMIMSRLMKDSGHLNRVVSSFTNISGDDRTVSIVMPALIGLLPMPGGALFSAPMVETALNGRTISGEEKTAINYWFRHIWEYWWPLYPGVVLAVSLLNIDTWRFMVVMAPLTIVSVLSGMLFLLKPMGRSPSVMKNKFSYSNLKIFLWEIMPIIIMVLVIIILEATNSLVAYTGFDIKIPGGVMILPGLAASTIWICIANRINFKTLLSSMLDKSIPPMILLIASIMIFKGIMVDSQAVLHIRNELVEYRIPVVLIIMIMPFISGLITGIAIGFVGASFPLVIPLFSTSGWDYISSAMLAYAFGYVGMMLSPVHLCFLLTKDYFESSLLFSYKYLILPCLSVLVAAWLFYKALGHGWF